MQKIKNNKRLKTLVAVAFIVAVALILVGLLSLFAGTSSNRVFTVTFNTGGGSIIASQEVTRGEVFVLEKPIDPTREVYRFVYWELDGKKFDFSKPILSDLALVAKWKPITYNISFNSNGGSMIPSQTIVYGGKIIKPSNPTRYGYFFAGWFLSGKEYDFTKVVESDLKLLAKWKADKTENEGSVTKTYPVDTTRPIITLLGRATENLANGATYTDAGARATDDVDGDITARIIVAGDRVNTANAGTYVVTYNVNDAAGNAAAEVTRKIIVAKAIGVSRITLEPKFSTEYRGAYHVSIQATIFPENATNKNIVWSSSNTSVATVVDGEVTVKAVEYRDRGLVIITATTVDGAKTARAFVSTTSEAETRAFWSINEAFKEDIFDTLDLTKEEDLRRVEGPLNSETFDRMAANLPDVEGKDIFLEKYISFRTKVNAARATFNSMQIETAKELISGASYTMTQETATDEAIIKAAIESIIAREISKISFYNEVRATVDKVEYTPAVAGDALDPAGINGTYTFTVDISNSSASGSTARLMMTIIATPFVDGT